MQVDDRVVLLVFQSWNDFINMLLDRDQLVNKRILIEDRRERFLGEIMDLDARKLILQGAQHRCRQDDIPNRTEPYDQKFHGLKIVFIRENEINSRLLQMLSTTLQRFNTFI